MGIFRGWQEWAHHVYTSAGANDAFRAVMTNAAGKVDDTLLDIQAANITDYSTSTWIPSLTFGGGSTGMTYNATDGQVGAYLKIGRLVFVSATILLSAKGSSTGTALISDLPFTVANGARYNAILAPRMIAATLTGDIIPTFIALNNTTTILCRVADSGANASMSDAHFTDTTQVMFSGCYIAAS